MIRTLRRTLPLAQLAEQAVCSNTPQLIPEGCSYAAAAVLPQPATSRSAVIPATAFLQRNWLATDASSKTSLFMATPHSLYHERQKSQVDPEAGLLRKVFLTLGGYYSKESTLMRGAEALYASVTEQATSPEVFSALELPSDFQHQHALLSLHVWLLLVRLRAEGKDGRKLAQMLYDNFQDDVEDRARKAGVKVRLQKQLTELERQFYGSSMAYDKALKGESGETLAAALLRNVYQGDESKEAAAAAMERYVKRELACLSMTETEAVMAGNVRFTSD